MATRTLTLSAECPPQPEQRSQCGRCLRDRLLITPGVRDVTLNCREGEASATLVLDYDPRLIPLTELDAQIRRAGVSCQLQRASVVLGVDGMISPRYEQVIESALSKLPGVLASASFASRSLRVEFDRAQCALPEIVRRLDDLGLKLRPGGPASAGRPPGSERKNLQRLRELVLVHHKLAMAIVGGLLLALAVITRLAHGPAALRYAAVSAGFVIAGWDTAIDTF